jgi:hypothetical protein
MGGKSDSGDGGQQDMSAANQALIEQQQLAWAQKQAQTKAAEEPVKAAEEKAKAEDPKISETIQQKEEDVVPGSENLTGLGDALVGGLGETQVANQISRVTADPQKYGGSFDPYTGTFTGQNVSGSV